VFLNGFLKLTTFPTEGGSLRLERYLSTYLSILQIYLLAVRQGDFLFISRRNAAYKKGNPVVFRTTSFINIFTIHGLQGLKETLFVMIEVPF
jgi:hypothetical protein